MWQYQNTDNMYIGRFDDKNNIKHSFKYIKKYIGKKGKMVYVYPKSYVKKTTGGYNEGDKNNQSWISYDNKKTGNNVTLVKGSNKSDKYVGISVGKVKDDYKYKEKYIKIGKYALNYDNENGQHNISLHIDHKKKNSLIESGKRILSKLFNRK